GAQAGGIYQHGAVMQASLVAQLAQPADDHELVLACERRPSLDGGSVQPLGQPARLLGIGEHVATDRKLGNDHHVGAAPGGVLDCRGGEGTIVLDLADPRRHLAAGDADRAHRRLSRRWTASRARSSYATAAACSAVVWP